MKKNQEDNYLKAYKEIKNAVLIGDLLKITELIIETDLNNLNSTDKFGRSILYDAIVKGYKDIVIELCKSGINVNNQDKDGKTPLHFAAIYNQLEILKFLILYGGDVNARDKNGNTPIFDAIFNSGGNTEIIQFLKDNNADFLTENIHGISPKYLANTISNFDVSFIFN